MEVRKRKPRADALKNRELLLAAARDVLGQGGPEASLEAVARQAGVGIGTLYRHFPTREDLFNAVFSRELEDLVRMVEGQQEAPDPVAAVRDWLHANVAVVETKRGMLGALSVVMTEESKQSYAELSKRLTVAVDHLLQRGMAEGRIRQGVTSEDLMQTMYALCYARPAGPDWRPRVLRLLDIFLDGLEC
ncbi:TetR/AcrR family transcriptional regulator [Chachezhania sediminis]|uniref:TetR/AcrR family transcriptional regulator n=1 Tax=Chachezhania sediminis TaxID=2599291 RepID=UPI00131B2FB8|nr:TetR/AcrR family transcriptional regulator [Chachezhania sediminis]